MDRRTHPITPGSLILCTGLLGAAAVSAQMPVQGPAPPQVAQSPADQAPITPTPAQSPTAPVTEWKTYSYPADGFSALFPSEPVQQKQSVPTDAGSFELRTYLVASGSVALYVGVCDYGAAANGSDPDAVLEGARNGAVTNVHAHLVNSKKVTLGIYPGVAFEAEAEGAHLFGRIYLVGTILYHAFVAGPSDQPFPGTTKFLDSFQLIPRNSP
jgi:hypothetical protein